MNSQKIMDSISSSSDDKLASIMPLLKKYGAYALLIVGLLFIAFGNFTGSSSPANNATHAFAPTSETSTNSQTANRIYIEEMQTRLEAMLSQISGVGDVTVMLTLTSGTQTVVASDEKITENITQSNDGTTRTQNINRDTRVATLRDEPLVIQELAPQIEGVVVVAEGARSETIARQINQAVVALTGVRTHRVVVLAKN